MAESESCSTIFFFSFCSLLPLMPQSSLLAFTTPCSLIAASSASFREMPSFAQNSRTLCPCLERVEARMDCTLPARCGLANSEERLTLFLSRFLLMVSGSMNPLYLGRFTLREGWIHSCPSQPLSSADPSLAWPVCCLVRLLPFSCPSPDANLLIKASRNFLRKGTEGFISSLSQNWACSSWCRLWLSLAIDLNLCALPDSALTSLTSTRRYSSTPREMAKTSSARMSFSPTTCSGTATNSLRLLTSILSDSSIPLIVELIVRAEE